jgi:hypothetical protein
LRVFADRFAAAAITLAVFVDGASAQTCFTMQAEMMHLQSRGVGGSGDRARYERAFREQTNILARTEMRARNANCFGGGFFLFRRQPDPSCNMLVDKIRDMQDNLDRLDQLRRRGGEDNAYRIRELRGMMNARGCDIPGGDVFDASRGDNFLFEPDAPYYSGGGTYRTLCVRTCDGYYFPISFSTTSEQFANDAQACTAMCPGAEARLFFYPNPGGAPESMMSITGEAYSSLPTAFQYRTSISPSCTCQPPGGYASVAALEPMAPAIREDPTAPLPRPRPGRGEDPETLADRAGYFVPTAAVKEKAGGTPVATNADGHSIRLVGPALGNAAQDALVISPVPN